MTDILFDGTKDEKLDYLLMKILEKQEKIATTEHMLKKDTERFNHPKSLHDILYHFTLKKFIKHDEERKIELEKELKEYEDQYHALLDEDE